MRGLLCSRSPSRIVWERKGAFFRWETNHRITAWEGEPPRNCRRLHSLRGWGDGRQKQVLAGGPGGDSGPVFEELEARCTVATTASKPGSGEGYRHGT